MFEGFEMQTDRGMDVIGFFDVEERDRSMRILKAHDEQGFSDEIFVSEVLRRLKSYEGKNWIFTHSNIQIFLANPLLEQINLEDIAHALSHLCRYSGQCNKFYCVAEHSVLVAQEVLRRTGDILLAAAALMHDAPEAYLCDVTGPLKDMLLVYKILEDRFEMVISEKFNLQYPFDHPEIKKSDFEVFFTEKDHLFDFPYRAWNREGKHADVKIECWGPELAKKRFLEMAQQLGIAA